MKISTKKTLLQLTGPRGGARPAIDAIRMNGGVVRESYIHAHLRGKSNGMAARIARKHGVLVNPSNLNRLLAAPSNGDRLAVPATKLWLRGDMDLVRFPSPYGRWNSNGCVPFGGYFSARNPGYGGGPRVIWNLRTGGFIGENGHIKPVRKPLP